MLPLLYIILQLEIFVTSKLNFMKFEIEFNMQRDYNINLISYIGKVFI